MTWLLWAYLKSVANFGAADCTDVLIPEAAVRDLSFVLPFKVHLGCTVLAMYLNGSFQHLFYYFFRSKQLVHFSEFWGDLFRWQTNVKDKSSEIQRDVTWWLPVPQTQCHCSTANQNSPKTLNFVFKWHQGAAHSSVTGNVHSGHNSIFCFFSRKMST